jgi:hypothetical protein
MAKVNPAKAVALGIYHFNPERTHHYGDSHEKRIEEFEDIMKLGYFNTVHVNPKYINDDELVEITPKSVRLRKKILDTAERKKFDSKKRNSEN